jgi:hypothetical protein
LPIYFGIDSPCVVSKKRCDTNELVRFGEECFSTAQEIALAIEAVFVSEAFINPLTGLTLLRPGVFVLLAKRGGKA